MCKWILGQKQDRAFQFQDRLRSSLVGIQSKPAQGLENYHKKVQNYPVIEGKEGNWGGFVQSYCSIFNGQRHLFIFPSYPNMYTTLATKNSR